MEKVIKCYRQKGNALQTHCFLIIPERLLEDDDENLIRNLMLRTQKLITLAQDLWPIVKSAEMTCDHKYSIIREKILSVKGLGDTWVKMLTVVLDIAQPQMRLLHDRCEVGVGASDPLRKILEQEGLFLPREQRENERREKMLQCTVVICPRPPSSFVKVMRNKKQIIQVTQRAAGSLDRAHAVAEVLCKLANEGMPDEQLSLKRKALLEDQCLNVPALGLDAKVQAGHAVKSELEAQVKETPTPGIVRALVQLRDRIVSSELPSAVHFRSILEEVEDKMCAYFKEYPLIVEQMKTHKVGLSCGTLQVQLCEFRQFENCLRSKTEKL